ncbi:hypothetical protein TCAL_08011 [Tigriopus californicus]|uniref:Uncharacterized protein n=1 Tax=Tigriopus californicus TaxID=6832 RepID=A0A553PIF1_TIGCA|nr:uncharacterized protein LOC131880475 [Tigriopus californicus]XP_059083114.1 uncharacterized protein LOC131880475 [Tigriopus californicus]XP_059083115.1 uncharacterized protein LOC131880475 [Tigriopus californicus]TRY77453.1 hypothetical protein TCAL_08011 [Tigriopus californicus]
MRLKRKPFAGLALVSGQVVLLWSLSVLAVQQVPCSPSVEDGLHQRYVECTKSSREAILKKSHATRTFSSSADTSSQPDVVALEGQIQSRFLASRSMSIPEEHHVEATQSNRNSSRKAVVIQPLLSSLWDDLPENITLKCELITAVLDQCSVVYAQCFNQTELRQHQDTQLELLLHIEKQKKAHEDLDLCPVVREYKESGRREKLYPTALCTEHQVLIMTNGYNECTQQTNHDMQNNMSHNIKNRHAMMDIMCDGMFKAVHECSELLKECYSPANVEETKESQKILMEQIFNRVVSDGRTRMHISDCRMYGGTFGLNRAAHSLSSPDQIALMVGLGMVLAAYI